MRRSESTLMTPVRSLFHPSDFTAASEVAFLHALRLALVTRAKLSMLHVATDPEEEGQFPGVRDTLIRWGMLPADSPKDSVAELGMEIRKVVQRDSDPVHSVLAYLKKHPTDLIVLATHQQKGAIRWPRRSVSEPIARESRRQTLFIPAGVPGFVSPTDGSIVLKNILVPVDHEPSPQAAVDGAAHLLRMLDTPDVKVTLLHVGPSDSAPRIVIPSGVGQGWDLITEEAEVVEGILSAADRCGADLLVMSTGGRQGFLDALRGTTTEQVIRRVRCPLLVVPVWEEPPEES